MTRWQKMTAIAAAGPALIAWGLATASPADADRASGMSQRADDAPKAAMVAWNGAMLDAVRKQNSAPGLASRNLAILHIAIFDALNAAAGQPYTPYAFAASPPPAGDSSIDQAGIVTGAAKRCADLLYPSERARFAALLQRCRDSVDDPLTFAAGEELGVSAADAILTERQSDGASRQITYVPTKEAGKWHRTAPKFRPPELPHWRNVTPFALEQASQFLPPPPPALESEKSAQEHSEVRRLGARNSKIRSAEQTEIANFWSCFNYTGTPAGHWNDIAQNVLPLETLTALELARIYALLNTALADAGIAAWDCKYHYRHWRPIQALADAGWDSLLEAPPHPEYVSGHSTFTGAGCAVLQIVLSGDKIEFDVRSDSLSGKVRHFSSLSQAAEEIGRSRIYGGIHFQSGNAEGLRLGQRVAGHVLATRMQSTAR